MSEKVPSRHNRRQKSRSTGRVHVSSEKDQRNRNASNTQEGVPVHMQGFYKECILTLLGCIDTALRLRKMIIVPYDCLRTNMREFPVSYFKEFIGERAEDAHRGDFFMNLLFEHKSLGIRIRPYGFGGISLSSVKWGFTLPAGLESILGQLNNLVLEDIRCVVNGQIQQQQQQQAEERQSDASKADQGLLSILTHGSPRKSSMAEQKTETPRREGGFDTLVKSLLKPCTSPKASNSQTTTTSGRNATSPRHQTRSEDDENRDRQLYKECLTLLVPIIAQHIERGTKDVDYELSPYSEMRAALSPGVVRDHSSFNRLLRGGGSLPRIDVYLNDGLRYREVGLQIIVVEDSLYTSNLYDIRWRLRLSEEKSLVVSKLIPDASEQVSDDTREGKDEEDVEDVEDLEDAKEQTIEDRIMELVRSFPSGELYEEISNGHFCLEDFVLMLVRDFNSDEQRFMQVLCADYRLRAIQASKLISYMLEYMRGHPDFSDRLLCSDPQPSSSVSDMDTLQRTLDEVREIVVRSAGASSAQNGLIMDAIDEMSMKG